MATQQKELILAYGEVTGHHHKVTGRLTVQQDTDDKKVFYTDTECVLTHEEHDRIVLPANRTIIMYNQVEYDPFNDIIRKVID